jgi:hypothetical protein
MLGNPGIFDHIMEQRRHQTLMVHTHFGEDSRDSQRMVDVGFAGLSKLAFVGNFREFKRPHDVINLILIKILGELGGKRIDGLHQTTIPTIYRN